MNEIIFRFFLNFKNNSVGRLEITEPIGFDGATFTIEQDKKRYGRDVTYGNEEVSLDFYSGVYSNGLTFEFENLINYYKEFGFESEVEFIVSKDGVDFVVGLLDFQLAETDQITYFKTKVIQNTNKAIVKRRDDVNVDVFSDKDLDDNGITPVGTSRILLKSKPVRQFSQWKSDVSETLNGPSVVGFFSPFRSLVNYGIDDSLTLFSNYSILIRDFALIKAKDDLTDLKIKLKFKYKVKEMSTPILRFSLGYIDDNGANPDFDVIYDDLSLDTTINKINDYSLDLDLNDYLQSSRKFVVFMQSSTSWKIDFLSYDLEISATSTAISSVIKGVRYIDYVKQVFKSATGLNVIAPKFDLGGKFYDNFVFNGKLIRQFINEPFYGNIKDNTSQLVELNSDLQVNSNNVYIGQYSDFYTNKDLGAFITSPEMGFKSSFNDRYAINTLEYKYKSFEQNRDESDTIDAIHTEAQFLLPNKQVENKLKIEVDFIRDPFEIESARRQGINTKETTSLSNDDKVYQIDIVPLALDSRSSFTRVLSYQYSEENNTFKILSNQSFNWLLLGFQIGDTVKINTIDYVVEAIESTILTLTYSGTSNATGEMIITVDYPLTAVDFVNRTNEGFTLIENILTGENFSNLRYSIKRNLKHWYPYLKTCCKFAPVGKIKNTFFKSNKDATTKFGTESVIIEGTDILVSELGDAILSPYVYNTKVVADYNDVLSVLEQMETINLDNSIGGFIRVMDNEFRIAKLYPTKLSYRWATAELDIIGEVKQESEYLEITNTLDGLITINEVGYERNIIFPLRLQTENNYIQILDRKGIALNNKIKFDKVRVNSIIFSNIVELSDNLLTL